MNNLKIALAQINPTVGDFSGNYNLITNYWHKAQQAETGIVIFPELSICGYNPQDLVLRQDFIAANKGILEQLVKDSSNHDSAIIVGGLRQEKDLVYNSAFVIHQGQIIHYHDKHLLPNYGVFDDKRIFTPGTTNNIFHFRGHKIGLIICEDLWQPKLAKTIAEQGAEFLISINASPYSYNKYNMRLETLESRTKETNLPIIYINQVGIQDSILYDGGSLIINQKQQIKLQSPFFREDLTLISLNEIKEETTGLARILPPINNKIQDNLLDIAPEILSQIYEALVFSLRDYLQKNNLEEVNLGFSSGIDSSLTAIIAMDAIGKDKVHLFALPSRYTSKETFTDAEEFCLHNEISCENIAISQINQITLAELADNFASSTEDTTEQNIQSRIRGLLLMAIANKHKYLLLSTGNKSEMAVGYATLYGDMNGGYNLLKDLYKLQVYQLANWRNENFPESTFHPKLNVIASNILTKAPTAELKPEQKDSDNIPPYDILDQILFNYIDLKKSKAEIVSLGFATEIVDQVLNLVRIAQFKRQQATLGVKISEACFDLDWRYPVINKFY